MKVKQKLLSTINKNYSKGMDYMELQIFEIVLYILQKMHIECLVKSSSFYTLGLTNALHQYGLHYIAGHCKSTEKIEEAEYEYSWRLGQWNLPDAVTDSLDTDCYQSLVYSALRSLQRTDKKRVLKIIDLARRQVLQSLMHSSLEASNNVYSVMSRLQSLQVNNFI